MTSTAKPVKTTASAGKQTPRRDSGGVYRMLRNAILRVELPPGMMLDETSLAEKMAVSRTPVREALIQLVADGLVVRQGRGVSVAPLDLAAIPALYDALHIASRLVQRLAAEMRTEEDLEMILEKLEEFEQLIDGRDGVLLTDANQAFHFAIAAATANAYVSSFYTSVMTETLRLNRICFSAAGYSDRNINNHLVETARQHRAIYKAIERRDLAAADALASEHYRLTRSRLDSLLAQRSESLSADFVIANGKEKP